MAIAVPRAQPRSARRSAWVHRRGTEPDTVLAAFMFILLLCGLAALTIIVNSAPASAPLSESFWPAQADGEIPREGAPPVPDVVPEAAVPPQAVAAPAPAVEPVPAVEQATEAQGPPGGATLAVGQTARVANTDGLGVVLHAAPSKDARMPAGLLEGARVTVVELASAEWVRVQNESGKRAGWVPASFVVPDS